MAQQPSIVRMLENLHTRIDALEQTSTYTTSPCTTYASGRLAAEWKETEPMINELIAKANDLTSQIMQMMARDPNPEIFLEFQSELMSRTGQLRSIASILKHKYPGVDPTLFPKEIQAACSKDQWGFLEPTVQAIIDAMGFSPPPNPTQ